MNQNFMKEKPVMPLVISMALPMTFSMLVNALYNIIDSYFVARISEDAMTIRSLGKENYMAERYDTCIGESYRAMEQTNFYDAGRKDCQRGRKRQQSA